VGQATVFCRRDELAEGLAPDDDGVETRYVHAGRYGNQEILEGLDVAHADHARLQPQEAGFGLDEFGRQVQLVVGPWRRSAAQADARRPDADHALTPMKRIAVFQIPAEASLEHGWTRLSRDIGVRR
jgi:hypothetical protein